MLCSHLGIDSHHCLHRSRFYCLPIGQAITPVSIVIAAWGSYTPDDFSAPPSDFCTQTAQSAHYYVRANGGIEELLPPENCYPRFLCGDPDPHPQHIVIALQGDAPFTRDQLRRAARLTCCLARQYGLDGGSSSPPVVQAAGEVDATKRPDSLPSTFWAYLSTCLSGDDADDVVAPEPSCCDALRATIAALTGRIDGLQARVVALESRPDPIPLIDALRTRVDNLETRLGVLEADYSTLQNAVANLSARFARIEQCFNQLPQCADVAPYCEIHYTLGARQRLVPNVQHVVNFDRRVSDDPSAPRVLAGPLWTAALSYVGEPATTWRVVGEVTIAPRNWCVNKYVRVYLQKCDGTLLALATWIAPTNGPQPAITLNWNTLITTPSGAPCFVRILIESDDTTEPFFELMSGYVRMSK